MVKYVGCISIFFIIILFFILKKHNANKIEHMRSSVKSSALNLYYFWNDQHIELKRIFEKSIEKHSYLNLQPLQLVTKVSTSDFGTSDFKNIITEKIKRIIYDVFPINNNNHFIISDIDIQVFKRFENILNDYKIYDIVFQKETRSSGYNTGFILVKNTPLTLDLFTETLDILLSTPPNQFINEQLIINNLLMNDKYKELNVGTFPNEIWAYTNQPMPNISTLILHHANATLPSENETSLMRKKKQLQKIKLMFDQR